MVTPISISSFNMVIIRQQLHRLPDDAIADLTGLPVDIVHNKIDEITGGGSVRKSKSQTIEAKLVIKQALAEQKAIQKVKKITAKKLKELNNDIADRQYKKAVKPVRLPKVVEPKYATLQVNYSEKLLVRIDKQTCIYINAGDDVETAKAAYHKRIHDAKASEETEKPDPAKPKTKICERCSKRWRIEQFSKKGTADVCNTCKDMLKRIKKEREKYNY